MKPQLRCSLLIFAAIFPFFAQAHTFGVGVRAAEGGGIQVWYRSWHPCDAPLFEGEIQIKGINGTTYGPSSAQATLTSCDSVNGTSTFPTFESTDIGYYCEVNASGQILNSDDTVNSTAQASLGTDPANPVLPADMNNQALLEGSAVGAILCTEDIYNEGSSSDKWQGSLYTNLAAGDYRVTYSPCDDDGDGSDCANGVSSSADWEADRYLVLSTAITISSELADAAKPPLPPTPPTPAPALPLFGLLTLGGLLGLFGLRKLKQ